MVRDKRRNHHKAMTTCRTIALTLTLAALAFGPGASAQDFPNPQPAEAHKLFAEDAGTWDATIKMFLAGPDAPPTEYKGVETSETVCGGLFAKTSFKAKMGEHDFEGHGLTGYDPATKEYVGTWVDSFSMTPTPMKGKYDAEKKTLTVKLTVPTGDGGTIEMKQVTTRLDQDTKKFENFLMIDGNETKVMEIVSKKRE